MLKSLYLAFIVAGVLTCATSAAAQPVTADKLSAARESFRAGKKKLEAGDYEGALVDYRIADAVVKKPSTRLGVARALVGLGRLLEARKEARSVAGIPEAPNEHPTLLKAREDAAALAEELNGRLGRVTFIVTPATAELVLDKQLLVTSQHRELEIDPGPHTIMARMEGYKTLERTFKIYTGRDLSLELQLSPLDQQAEVIPEPKRYQAHPNTTAPPSSAPDNSSIDTEFIGGVSSLAVGAALFGVGVWGMTQVHATSSDAEFDAWRTIPAHANEDDVCELNPPPNIADVCSQMKQGEITQLVAFSFAAAAASVGIALIVLSPTVSDDEETSEERALTIAPVLSPHHIGASLHYSF